MKYELTEETMDVCGITLRRIRYLSDGGPGGMKTSKLMSRTLEKGE
jgi:hypothetical protein